MEPLQFVLLLGKISGDLPNQQWFQKVCVSISPVGGALIDVARSETINVAIKSSIVLVHEHMRDNHVRWSAEDFNGSERHI